MSSKILRKELIKTQVSTLLAHIDDPEVKELIMSQSVIPSIFQKQTPKGTWTDQKTVKKYGADDFLVDIGYLPTYRGTVWQLIIFAELGADGSDSRIQKACEHVLSRVYRVHDSEGYFTIDPTLIATHSQAPCFVGNMIFSLYKLG